SRGGLGLPSGGGVAWCTEPTVRTARSLRRSMPTWPLGVTGVVRVGRRVETDRNLQAATILVEVNRPPSSGDLAPRAIVPEEFRHRAAELAEAVADVAEQFRSRLSPTLTRPASGLYADSIEIEFNISLQAEAGVIIAKTTAGATFTTRLTL